AAKVNPRSHQGLQAAPHHLPAGATQTAAAAAGAVVTPHDEEEEDGMTS
ncbi:unnamed protein product, partial [Heterosigma akashiwo]